MTKCEVCGIPFPDDFFSPTFINGHTIIADPECARLEIGKTHGVGDAYQFTGEYAKQLHEDFMEWKSKNRKDV